MAYLEANAKVNIVLANQHFSAKGLACSVVYPYIAKVILRRVWSCDQTRNNWCLNIIQFNLQYIYSNRLNIDFYIYGIMKVIIQRKPLNMRYWTLSYIDMAQYKLITLDYV